MEVKKTVSTAELLPPISALKIEMQKKGYSPQTLRGLENVWDTLLRYASTVPETLFDENFRGGFLQAEYGFRMDLEYTIRCFMQWRRRAGKICQRTRSAKASARLRPALP